MIARAHIHTRTHTHCVLPVRVGPVWLQVTVPLKTEIVSLEERLKLCLPDAAAKTKKQKKKKKT